MIISARTMYLYLGAGVFVLALILMAFSDGSTDLEKRLERVGGEKKNCPQNPDLPHSVRSNKDSTIPLIDRLVKLLPNPDKMRIRLSATGKNIALGEYMLMNALLVLVFHVIFSQVRMEKIVALPLSFVLGLGLPHAIVGFMAARRKKKFIASFPEAIDTMCRGIRSGLPITESISVMGREMPDPMGIEFCRISDSIRLGMTLEDAMWDVAQRIDSAEFRFLIIAMSIQRETGGNLAETLGNLSELIRKRRQLRLKVKAMSSEAKASAMIIGSLPFIMLIILGLVNPEYVSVLFTQMQGRVLLGIGFGWMSLGWTVMMKMTHFEV